jgi:protein ImuA
MIEELRQRLRRLEKPPGLADGPAALPLGAPAVDAVLGGGLMRGALHEIAAAGEAHVAAASGFVLGVAALVISGRHEAANPRGLTAAPRNDSFCCWIAEDMATLESGAPYGPGLDGFGLAPERLVTVAVAQRRDLLWAMEEALRCRAVACVIGEMRHGALDMVAVRRLSLAAAESGALALMLRAAPQDDASTAATRWVVGAPSPGGGGSPSEARRGGVILQKNSPPPGALKRADLPPPGGGEKARFAASLLRNRRGARGQWILEWSDNDGHFTRAAHAQPVAEPPVHRPHQKVA